MTEKEHSTSKRVRSILAEAVVLSTFLIAIRSYVLEFRWSDLGAPIQTLGRAVLASWHDFLYVAVLTLVVLLGLSVAGSHKKTERALFFVYTALIYLSLLISLANIKVVKLLGAPFSIEWLYYSDFLRGSDAQSAIAHSFSWSLVFVAAGAMIAMGLFSGLVTRALAPVPELFFLPRTAIILLTVAGVIYFPVARVLLPTAGFRPAHLENPVISFLVSVARSSHDPLLGLQSPIGSEDFQTFAERRALGIVSSREALSGIRNVLVIVLESVPSKYIGARFGAEPVTPELDKLRPVSIRFQNFYAHAPATAKSLVAILTSSYPWISYRGLTREYPEIPLASLAEEFDKRGYRTAMFLSADARFLGQDRFLANRGFDLVQDFRTRRCDTIFVGDDDGYWGASHDACTADSLLGWIREAPQTSFFALAWTNLTHFPYHAAEPEIEFSVGDKLLNRYLNALRNTDEVLGGIVEELEREDLLASTLIVVSADHGESFGRYPGTVGHTRLLHEENIRVPLILISPHLTGNRNPEVLGGLIDVAPTITNLLGWPSPGTWQGRDLFGDEERPRAYFFASLSLSFGYREGRKKYLYNARIGQLETYDLGEDPEELNNIGGGPEELLTVRHRLAAWVQYQSAFKDQLISRGTATQGQD